MSRKLWAGVARFAVAWGALALLGCARITETTTFTHTVISRKQSVEVVPSSVEYSATSQLQGRSLLVAVARAETCRTKVVPILRKEAHTKREVADGKAGLVSSPTASLLTGLTLLGLGAFSYLDAERLSLESSNPEESTPDDFRATGVVLGGVSLAFFGISLIDAIRLRDSDEVVGEVEGEPEVTAALCRKGVAGEVAVRLGALSNATATATDASWKVEARTDDSGTVRFDLLSLDEGAFADGGPRLQLSIDAQRLPLVIVEPQGQELLALLAAEPSSRVAQDRERRQSAECESKVAGARASAIDETSSDDEVADAERAWQRAEELCGARWRDEHGAARDELRAQISSTAAARASLRCAAAGQRATEAVMQYFDDEGPPELEALRQSIEAACAGAANAKKVQGAWAIQAAVAGAAEELEQNLLAHDAVALRGQLRDPNLAAAFRQPRLSSYFPPLAEHWIAAMEGGATSAAVRVQFCAARALFLSFVGKARWTQLRAEVARRNDVMTAAQVIRAMDGGGCK